MRIALIHYRLVRNGGLETRLLNYIRYFAEAGHQITVVVCKVDASIPLPKGVAVRQVRLKWVPKPLRLYFLDRALRHIILPSDFDLSISMGRTSHQDMVVCPGTHLGYLRALGKRFWSPMDWLNVHMDRLAYARSKVILAASEMMAEEMRELYGVPAEKIRVLHPPADVGRFHPAGKSERQAWRERHGFSPERRSLLLLTTGNRLKGYAFALEVMRLLKDEPIELIVAGMTPMATDLPNVRFVGYANRPEELLWAADALIVPSLYEAFGQVVAESLACGTPVVVSHRVGAKHLVIPGLGRVVEQFDVGQWAQAIRGVLSADEGPLTFKGTDVGTHCDRILRIAQEEGIGQS